MADDLVEIAIAPYFSARKVIVKKKGNGFSLIHTANKKFVQIQFI